MTYSAGNIIVATDYNGFVGPVNTIYGSGSGDSGWGQSATIPTLGTGTTVSATQWASLVNTLSTVGAQEATTITSRTAPTTGTLVSILANVSTDITSCTTNRGFAAASGTTSNSWTGAIAKTSSTGVGNAAWTITWTQTVTFADANSARYFWNAGGLVRLDMSKSSTGNDIDPDWNTFVGTVGTLYMSGRVNSAAQTIAGVSYTGFTRVGGSGTPGVNNTTAGWYALTPGGAAGIIFQLNSSVYPYTSDYIRVSAAVNAGSTVLTLTTQWNQVARAYPTTINGGTDTTSPYTSFGTAPAVLCRYVPPSNTYLTTTWGTPAIASSVA
jgi:hypothetical protein